MGVAVVMVAVTVMGMAIPTTGAGVVPMVTVAIQAPGVLRMVMHHRLQLLHNQLHRKLVSNTARNPDEPHSAVSARLYH